MPSWSDPCRPSWPDGARVAYVTKVYPRFSETFVVSEILGLEALGADLEIVSLRLPVEGRFHPQLAQVRAPVTYLAPTPRSGADLWAAIAEARPLLARLPGELDTLLAEPADVAAQAVALARHAVVRGITRLHAHFATVATTVARLASRLAGVPYSFTAHAKDIFHSDVDELDLARKLRGAAAVVTVSDHNVEYLRRRFGEDAARVTRVYNGIDLQRFRFRDGAARGCTAGEPLTIAAVGRLVEKKGFADLIEACALLAAPVRCRIAGAGELEGELRSLIAARRLEHRVTLVGPLSQDGVRDLVGAATVLAAPCVVGADGNRDGLPTVVLEAMALGTPVVATAVTGLAEVVHDGVTGLVVPERDPVALAAALARVCAEPPLAERLRRTARALVERDFDVRRQAAQLLPLLTVPGAAEVVA